MSKFRKKKTSHKESSDKSSRKERTICTIGYIIVPLFFVVLYSIMFMSYEDIYQSYAWQEYDTPEIIRMIYLFIPRIGEIFQRVAAHFMTISSSFGLDLFFRLITAAIGSLLIFLSTTFILGRRPKFQYKDVMIYLGLFIIYLISEVSETFTFRFSYANNYLIAGVLTIGFLLPFRLHLKAKKIWHYFAMIFLGIAFGMSTEIGPLAILIIFSLIFIYKLFNKRISKTFFKKNKLQLIGIIGMLIGILLIYGNGSLTNRADSSYGLYYDYVSVFDIIKNDTIVTLYKLWQHAWFNMRYLMFAPLILGIFMLTEWLISKQTKAKTNLKLYIYILSFCILYMAASCQIKVLDDLYPRYFFLVYTAIFIAIFIFINHLIHLFPPDKKKLVITVRILIVISVLAFLDMAIAFTVYRIQISDQLYKIQPDTENKTVLITEDYSKTTMIPSPIFRLSQLSPFDWGNLGDGYMKYGYGPKPASN